MSRWRSWGRKLSWSLLCSWPIATGAGAADQWRSYPLGAAGPTGANIIVAKCDADHVLIGNRAATSATNSGILITLAASPTVTTFNLFSPSTASYGKLRALGCNATTIVAAGGNNSTNGSEWIASSTLASPASWTSQRDQVNTGFQRLWQGVVATGPGSRAWTMGMWLGWTDTHHYVEAVNFDISSFTTGSAAFFDKGANGLSEECNGNRTTRGDYGAACYKSGAMHTIGFSGSGIVWGDAGHPIACGALTGTVIAGQAFAGSTNQFLSLSDNGTNSQICGASYDGSTAGKFADQTFTSLLMRGGVYFWSNDYIWTSGGVAYVGGGSVSSYFSDESGSTHDIACDSGNVLAVIAGVDVDRDGDSTDNVLAFCGSGNAVYWGEALPSTSGSAASKQAPPFRALPFRFPEMP